MCEAGHWRRLSLFCVICFLLCVLFDVHCHAHADDGADGAAAAASPSASNKRYYDAPVRAGSTDDPLGRTTPPGIRATTHDHLHEMEVDGKKEDDHDHDHDHDHNNETETTKVKSRQSALYLKLLIRKYGRNGSLTFEGLEHLLAALHLGRLRFDSKHSIEDHLKNRSRLDSFENLHSDHDHDIDHDHEEVKDDHKDHDHRRVKRAIHVRKRSINESVDIADRVDTLEKYTKHKCLSAMTMFAWYHPVSTQEPLRQEEFKDLCPSLIYQLDANVCRDARLQMAEKAASSAPDWRRNTFHAFKVWGCSIGAVLVISLVGLAVVAVIPLMHHSFYNTLIQFLIAMAVGCLAGDALLHLIPHALFPEGEDGHDHGPGDEEEGGVDQHAATVFKSLAAFGGIYFFFLAERALLLCQKKRYKRRRKRRTNRLMSQNSSNIGAKLCNPYHKSYSNIGDLEIPLTESGRNSIVNGHTAGLAVACAASAVGHDPGADMCDNLSLCTDSHMSSDLAPGTTGTTVASLQQEEDHTETNGELNHGHSHGAHGHSHDISSFKSLVWTVIMGDGLHNFCDGMAIGAAFANDLRGGLSTTVAVFCHELPHELGDFAVLLNAGMSVKSALFYNMVSSVLCLLGMGLGVFLGNYQNAAQWIFMMTAGMFLYIALVDMMPELVTDRISKSGARPSTLFFFQNLGILIGASVMLLIALFEDKMLG